MPDKKYCSAEDCQGTHRRQWMLLNDGEEGSPRVVWIWCQFRLLPIESLVVVVEILGK